MWIAYDRMPVFKYSLFRCMSSFSSVESKTLITLRDIHFGDDAEKNRGERAERAFQPPLFPEKTCTLRPGCQGRQMVKMVW